MSYVESATLRVVDQSTGPIRKIRKELAALHKEARALKRSLNSSTSMLGPGASGASAVKAAKAARETTRAAVAMTAASAKMNRASAVQAKVIRQTAKASKDLAAITSGKSGRANPANGMRGVIAVSRAAEKAEAAKVRGAERLARQERVLQQQKDRAQAKSDRQRAASFARMDREFARAQKIERNAPRRSAIALTPERGRGSGAGRGSASAALMEGRPRRSSGGGAGSVYSGFPGNVIPMAKLYMGYATIHGVKTVVVHAARAVMERSEAEAQDRIRGFTPQEIERNRNITRQTTALFPQLGQTEQRGAVRQLITLMGGKSPEDLQAVALELARGQAAVSGIKGTENAQRFAEQSVKVLDRLNITNREDAINALKAMARGQLIGEKDLSFQQVLNNFRNAGTAVQGMSPDAMFNLIMAVDEAGLQAARNLRTFSTGMTRGTLQKSYKASLNKYGIGHGATLKDPEMFQRDPYEWVAKYVPDALKKAGYDIKGKDLNSARELIKLRVALDKIGFLPEAMNFPLLALQQREARARQQEAARKIDFGPVERPQESIALTVQAIGNSFKDLAAELTPIADNLLAPQLFKIQTAFRDFATYIRPSVDSIVQDGLKLRDIMPVIAGGAAVAVAGIAKWAMENPTQAAEAGSTAVFSASVLKFSGAVNKFAASSATSGGGPRKGGTWGPAIVATGVAGAAYVAYSELDAAKDIKTDAELKAHVEKRKEAWGDSIVRFGDWLAYDVLGQTMSETEKKRREALAARNGLSPLDNLLDTTVVEGVRSKKGREAWATGGSQGAVNFNDWNFVAREGFVNSAEEFKATMDEGSAFLRGEIKGGFSDSIPTLTAAGSQFGTNAGTSMNTWASEFGRIAGSSFQNAVGAISIDLSSASNAPDVGANINSVR